MSFQRKAPVLLAFATLLLFMFSACGSVASPGTSASTTIAVVAAENFYGDIAKQIGGSYVAVTSILSDPNVDPHQYEANPNGVIAVTNAKLVIENGGGYDDWMDKLLASAPNSARILLKGFDLAQTKLPANEHVWYSIDNAQTIAQTITDRLKSLDPAHAAAFASNFQAFKQALDPLRQKISEIKSKYAGTPVGLTETIFLYQSGPLGLAVLTPAEFQKAMAEGNDPPADTVVLADDQIRLHKIKVLLYNEQTVSPFTTKLQNDASAAHIPLVPVTETMPAGKTYQSWMLAQLNALEQALAK